MWLGLCTGGAARGDEVAGWKGGRAAGVVCGAAGAWLAGGLGKKLGGWPADEVVGLDVGAVVEGVKMPGLGGIRLIAGDAPALDVAGLREPKGGVAIFSVVPDDAGAGGVVVGAFGGSGAFGKKLEAGWVGVGCCVVDGAGCPNLKPAPGAVLGWAEGVCTGGWLEVDAMGLG